MEETHQEIQIQRILLADGFQAPGKARYFHVVLVDNYGLLYRKAKSLPDADRLASAGGDDNHAVGLEKYSQYDRLLFKDVVGCHCMKDPVKKARQGGERSQGSPVQNGSKNAYFCVYAYPLRKRSFRKGLRRQRVSLTLAVNRHDTYQENLAEAEKWRNEIHKALNELPERNNGASRKLLIFVSPKSGPGKALAIFQQRIAPVLGEASVAYDLIVTERQNHARDYVKNADLTKWDGIATVAGDGLIYEIVNGIMERPDWTTAIKTPIGVVPGGSGNGLSHSIAHAIGEPSDTNSILLSAFNLAKAKIVPMDLVRVETPTQTIYSFLSIGWGIMADIDIESERLRALGESRFTLWALHRIARLKYYKGRLSYLPVPGYVPRRTGRKMRRRKAKNPTLQRTQSTYVQPSPPRRGLVASKSLPDDLEKLDEDEGSDSNSVSLAVDALTASEIPDDDLGASSASLPVANGDSTPASVLPPLDAPVPDGWVQWEEEFVLVYVVYQTHIGTSLYLAPEAALADGLMWLVVVRKGASRAQLVSFMLALEKGGHADQSFVEMLPVRAFRLEPLTGGGHLTVDGELIDYGPIQAEVMPSLARVMVH